MFCLSRFTTLDRAFAIFFNACDTVHDSGVSIFYLFTCRRPRKLCMLDILKYGAPLTCWFDLMSSPDCFHWKRRHWFHVNYNYAKTVQLVATRVCAILLCCNSSRLSATLQQCSFHLDVNNYLLTPMLRCCDFALYDKLRFLSSFLLLSISLIPYFRVKLSPLFVKEGTTYSIRFRSLVQSKFAMNVTASHSVCDQLPM